MNSFGARFRRWDRDFGWTYRTALFVAFLIALIGAPFWILAGGHRRFYAERASAALQKVASPALSDSSAAFADSVLRERPLYPYSVIAGGAYSETELARAIQNDPVVAHHYADFHLADTRVLRLNHTELMYVSYRIGSHIFWTKEPLVIPAGEVLLTDGKNAARTRCGNRLSASRVAPVAANPPRPEAMNAALDLSRRAMFPAFPQIPRLPPAFALIPDGPGRLGRPTLEAIAPPISAGSLPPLYWPVVGDAGPPSGPLAIVPPAPPLPIAAPEPGTFPLLGVGLAILAVLYFRKSKVSRHG